jgi:hypothetical protein
MSSESARTAVIRKFTNYRNLHKNETTSSGENTEVAAMREVANQLADFRTYSKGRTVFKLRKHNEIRARQEALCRADPSLAPIAAYSKAVKQLWSEEDDHGYWEAEARELGDDIFA